MNHAILLRPSTGVVSISHLSAVVFQIKNKKDDYGAFTEDSVKHNKFNLGHIEGVEDLLEKICCPYI